MMFTAEGGLRFPSFLVTLHADTTEISTSQGLSAVGDFVLSGYLLPAQPLVVQRSNSENGRRVAAIAIG